MLVAFRGVYYFLPFFVAALALVATEVRRHHRRVASHVTNAATLAGEWLPTLIPRVLAATTFLAGAVLLTTGALPAVESRMAWLARVAPLGAIEAAHFTGSVAGAALLVVARGLWLRRDGAYWVATAAARRRDRGLPGARDGRRGGERAGRGAPHAGPLAAGLHAPQRAPLRADHAGVVGRRRGRARRHALARPLRLPRRGLQPRPVVAVRRPRRRAALPPRDGGRRGRGASGGPRAAPAERPARLWRRAHARGAGPRPRRDRAEPAGGGVPRPARRRAAPLRARRRARHARGRLRGVRAGGDELDRDGRARRLRPDDGGAGVGLPQRRRGRWRAARLLRRAQRPTCHSCSTSASRSTSWARRRACRWRASRWRAGGGRRCAGRSARWRPLAPRWRSFRQRPSARSCPSCAASRGRGSATRRFSRPSLSPWCASRPRPLARPASGETPRRQRPRRGLRDALGQRPARRRLWRLARGEGRGGHRAHAVRPRARARGRAGVPRRAGDAVGCRRGLPHVLARHGAAGGAGDRGRGPRAGAAVAPDGRAPLPPRRARLGAQDLRAFKASFDPDWAPRYLACPRGRLALAATLEDVAARVSREQPAPLGDARGERARGVRA